jgi:hypothetical protein
MTRLAIAALAAVVLTAAHAPPRPRAHAAVRVYRAVVVSGSAQSGRAWVAPAQTKYLTEFAHPLVVRVDGPPPPPKQHYHVRFRCVSRGAAFSPANQPRGDDVQKNEEDDSYTVVAADGRAVLGVALATDSPTGMYRVVAEPVVAAGERAVPATIVLSTY